MATEHKAGCADSHEVSSRLVAVEVPWIQTHPAEVIETLQRRESH